MSKRATAATRSNGRWLAGAVAVVALGGFWYLTRPAEVAVEPRDLVAAARAAGGRGDFAAGLAAITAYQEASGETPEGLEALSWLGRTALAAGDLAQAESFAQQTYDRAEALLAVRPLDQEPRLPIAVGAAIEVLGQAAAARGARTEAVSFLEREFARFQDTSIAMRIQKNINLVSLEGTAAPALDLSEYIGATPAALADLRGQVVLMFFWAHWCSDCRAQGPILEVLASRYGEQGLTIVAPTQRYGYVARGALAPPDEERRYIEDVRETYYPMLEGVSMPLAAANHLRYGVSTTPTLVLADRNGVVRLYHPGQMDEGELDPLIRDLIDAAPTAASSSG